MISTGTRRAFLLAFLCFALAAPAASAHPLGNFSVNHQTRVKISRDRVELLYILSKAEVIKRKQAEVNQNLYLVVNGRRHLLDLAGTPKLTFPEGAGGLPITR